MPKLVCPDCAEEQYITRWTIIRLATRAAMITLVRALFRKEIGCPCPDCLVLRQRTTR